MTDTTHTADTPAGEWLTVRQVAAELNCGPSLVYSLMNAGHLAYTDFGAKQTPGAKGGRKGRRVRRAVLDAFIAARTQPAQP